MCGIAGLLNQTPVGADTLRTHVLRMSDALRLRGPDDDGDWTDQGGRVALAFRRLAILDLSPTGAQPMVSPSGRFVMTFNGEVYNFKSLRSELQEMGIAFRGGSDSEVILAAFDAWGVEETLPRLIGMFAIALWDTAGEELLLCRDSMGIKPLYVARTAGGIAYASELGALTQAPGLDLTVDSAATLTFLRYLYVPAPGTPLRDVRKLLPGHFLRIPADTCGETLPEPTRFWSLDDARARGDAVRVPGKNGDASADEAYVDALEELLSDAVKLRMVADVPVGALLSGGLDSSLVVGLMQKAATHPVRTFTIGFDDPEHDESTHARAIAEHLGTDHTELFVTDEDALAIIPSLPEIFDEPLADPSQIPTYLVSRLAREQVTVALTGDGGDELFAGYTRYTSGLDWIARMSRTPKGLRRLAGAGLRAVHPDQWERASELTGEAGQGTRLVGQKVHKLGRMLGAASPGEMYRTLLSTSDDPERFMPGGSSGWDPIRDAVAMHDRGMSLSDMLLLDQKYYLPDDLLQKVDRASMAASLEARVPILDHRIVEFSWTLPDHLKIRDGEGKWILRQVLYRHVPRDLLDRPKTGFSVPVAAWFRGALREWAEDLLLSESFIRDGLFDARVVRSTWDQLLSGRDETALSLWTVVMFEGWRRRWKITEFGELGRPVNTPACAGLPDARGQ